MSDTNPAPLLNVNGRPFRSHIAAETLDDIQQGTMTSVYRGVPFYKNPFDIALYLQLLSRLAPKTIFEVGTKYGGSALWFADMLSAQGISEAHIYSVDITPLANFTDPRITFLEGDADALEKSLPADILANCPHPWLIIEDSSHYYQQSLSVLKFFHEHMVSGDYIVVEDGIVNQLSPDVYRRYEDGPSRAIADFMAEYGHLYEIDISLCDHFGFNATYNPNGWLRRL